MRLKKEAGLDDDDDMNQTGNMLKDFENEMDDMGSQEDNKSNGSGDDHRTYGIKSD